MELIRPEWEAPDHIKVVTTTRSGGVSREPYDSFNLGDHVGDDPRAVSENRLRLQQALSLKHIQWLEQVHGTDCIESNTVQLSRQADACWTDQPDLACAVMTADCLPVVITDGERVAASHAGWRGLCNGVLERTLGCFQSNPSDLHVWLGPAISRNAFEVGSEVRDQFCSVLEESKACFIPSHNEGKWMADLYGLARLRLKSAGVNQVSGGEYCTFSETERFYSYRRQSKTGRLVTLVWKTLR